jgi:hypothetical protein
MTDISSTPVTARSMNPLLPALIAASVALAGVAVGALLDWQRFGFDRDSASRQTVLEIARIKRDIVDAVNNYDLPTARLLLTHVLEPIDDPARFHRFSAEFLELVAGKVVSNDPRAKTLEQQSQPILSPSPTDPTALVRLFEGPERLTASNQLVQMFRDQRPGVVPALIGALLPEKDQRSYRVNLYVAYTLGRLPGGWPATQAEVAAVRALTTSRSYADPTFKARVDEALKNALSGPNV